MCPTPIPIKSTKTVFPKIIENPRRTHGKYGAWKFNNPKKFILKDGFLLDHTYTSIKVNACPRNNKSTKNPKNVVIKHPNKNIITKSELLPRKEPSSSIRQYRYVKIKLKKKLKLIDPKNRKVVRILHNWSL